MRAPLLLVVVGLALAGCAQPGEPAATLEAPPAREPDSPADPLAVFAGVAVSLDTPEKARAAGYAPDPNCVPRMGAHWMKRGALDDRLDVQEPEAVLFDGDGRFVGLEYVVVTEGRATNTSATVPTLLGVKLSDPMPGHFPGMPWHAELHVYLAPEVPRERAFEPFQDSVRCPTPEERVLAKARAAAASLDTPAKALAAGYRPDGTCIPGMGAHWMRADLLDTTFDPDAPEALLFVPDEADGDFSDDVFVGLEYVLVTEGTEFNSTATPFTWEGIPFEGPMPGHFRGMPFHAELHVYLLEGGAGVRTTSDAVVCPPGTTPPRG
ncbi:MAG TPA: hypothetical protein VM582_07625 [Candidatus Thermoplasmatota archaeon]|nr:hypothetical protein [Candidatus Thermoplasmatota archaeon]